MKKLVWVAWLQYVLYCGGLERNLWYLKDVPIQYYGQIWDQI